MSLLVPLLWTAGGAQLLIASVNIFLPGKLNYRENLARLSPLVRQIFIVHSLYIVLVLLGFAALCFLHAEELASGRGLGRFLSSFLAVFWLLRLSIQLLYYDRDAKRENRWAHLVLTVLVLFLGAVFSFAAMGGSAT